MGNILKVDEYDILLDVNKAYQSKRDKILSVHKAVLEQNKVDLDTSHKLRAFLFPDDSEAKAASPSNPLNDFTYERLIGVSNDLLSIETLEQGLIAAKSVGMLKIGPLYKATGFLVGQNLVMTNWHNIQDKDDADKTRLVLGYEDNDFGERKVKQTYLLKPERFYFSDKEHDLAIIAVHPKSTTGEPLAEFGSLRLSGEPNKVQTGEAVNIIQHPSGEKKRISMHNSNLVALDDDATDDQFCYYSADTLKGSSGSPVFNKSWDVIALHRKGVPKINAKGEIELMSGASIQRSKIRNHDTDIRWLSNQGVRIQNIISTLKNSNELSKPEKAIREKLFEYWGLTS